MENEPARQRSVDEARSVRLDPDRQQAALRRIAASREVALHHEAQAAAARGQMLLLTRTWDLCPTHDHGGCCGDPERCVYAGG